MRRVELSDILLEVYRAIYKEIGYDFDSMEKDNNDWFMNHEMSDEDMERITNTVMNNYRLKPYQRQCIMNSMWLGCSPKSKKV